MSALVSIVTPAYNSSLYIAKSINSVLAQTYANWEMLIVDDGSTDNTLEIVRSYEDKRIKIFNNTHQGAAEARNLALRQATGKYVAFLDSDDLWLPEKLEKQVRFMEENHYDFSYTNFIKMSHEGVSYKQIVSGPKKVSKFMMFMYCWPGCLTVMFNRENIGLIQVANIKRNNDYAMWLKISRKATCHLLAEPLSMYRLRYGSISDQNYFELIKWHYRLYRQAEKMNPLKSAIITGCNLVFGFTKKIKYQWHDKSVC
ncbi:MAG: glycosyltransferase family 2 protein [Prevotella sp.]|nr:glycosyltransferase family 2 protein [Candidatus Equicola faecalis]